MLKRVRLTRGMLDVMLMALNEVEAGEGFQGVPENSAEQRRLMNDLTRAQAWIYQELAGRKPEQEKS
jgi:hypothetical protein